MRETDRRSPIPGPTQTTGRTPRNGSRYFPLPNSLAMGSKNSSTTRSFSGMIALSVILISSGQTLVQHLVMLQ